MFKDSVCGFCGYFMWKGQHQVIYVHDLYNGIIILMMSDSLSGSGRFLYIK